MVKEYHILEAQKPKIRAPRDSVFAEIQVLHLLFGSLTEDSPGSQV